VSRPISDKKFACAAKER